MTKTYRVKETFKTIQGEGTNAGRSATFIRFTGCNLWTGREEDRQRSAERNVVQCPLWCDTDFVGGDDMTADDLRAVVREHDADIIVLTGGEPLLQIDADLLLMLRGSFQTNSKGRAIHVAIETNGTIPLDHARRRLIDHVTVSPKVGPDMLEIREGDELRVVVPAYDAASFEDARQRGSLRFDRYYVSPQAHPSEGPHAHANTAAVEFALNNREWRLSIQSHKYLGIA